MAQILLIEDELNFRQLVGAILTRERHQVTNACDGIEALRLVHNAPTAFDLIITDLIMPGKEGIETIIELRKELPLIKIIAMTGGGFGRASSYLSLATAFGVNKTLMKPFSRQEIVEAVDDTLCSVPA